MRYPPLLQVSAAGLPVEWIHWQQAVCLYASGKVLWDLGEQTFAVRGGYRSCGSRSVIHLKPVLAVNDRSHKWNGLVPPLCRRSLYRRDGGICMYCGERVAMHQMTMDHIVPESRGGRATWTNMVLSCKPCNNRKDNRTPEEANMRLLALPYEPNQAEFLLLQNRRVLADQDQFLRAMLPKGSRLAG